MQAIPHQDYQEQFYHLPLAIVPMQVSMRSTPLEVYIAKGQPVFKSYDAKGQSYLVISGEVAILRNGRPIDLVECGEILDLRLWPSTTAMALSACTLVTLPLSGRIEQHEKTYHKRDANRGRYHGIAREVERTLPKRGNRNGQSDENACVRCAAPGSSNL